MMKETFETEELLYAAVLDVPFAIRCIREVGYAKVELHGKLAYLENELGQSAFHTLVALAKEASAILETNRN